MANKRFDYVIGFNADTSKLSSALKQLEVQLNKIATGKISGNFGIEQIREASSAATQLGAHLKAAINVDTGKLDISKFARSLHSSNTTLSSLSASLTKVGPAGQVAFMNIARAITEAEMPLKRSSELMDKLWITMKNTVRWQITSGLLTGFTGAIGDAYRYAEDLNKSLNNIRIVTGKSTAEMAQFAKQANRAAKELNTTTTKYTDASLIYYQQGLDDKQVKARTDVTAKFANVSRENLTTSSEYLTAIWNNFAKGSENLEYFADVIVALGAATASSSQEIATGLNRFAATAETVGLSYEYATAALATVTATTRQSAEVVGTAFKTLFSRIQDLELGKTLDDGTTLGKYSKALDAVGVSIKDSNGELRDMDRILDDIGGKWDTLNKDEQVALAQAVGGVRQYTQFIALMDNWDFMKENLETAKGATGELQKQADIFAESWEAAHKNVKASAEGIYDSLVKDEFWIDLTNGFADGLKSVELFADSIGGLKGVLALATIAMNKLVGPKVAQSIRDVAYNIGVLTGKEREHTIALKESALAEIKKYANSQGNFASDKNEVLFYQQLGQYQIDLNELMKKYNAEQVESVQHLLEQVQAAQNLAVELSKAAKAASNESQIFVDAAGEELFKRGAVTTMGGRNFVTYSTKYGSGTEYLQAAEENAYQRTQAQSIKELLKSKSFSWKNQKSHLLTAFGLDSQTTKDDFKAYVDNLIKASEEEMARLAKESKFFGSNIKGKSVTNLLSEAQERGAARGSTRAQQLAGYIDAFSSSEDAKGKVAALAGETDDFATTIVKTGSAVSSLTLAIQSFQSLGRLFTDKDMTDAEKLQTFLMSIGTLLPTLTMGVKELKSAVVGSAFFKNTQAGIRDSLYIQGGKNVAAEKLFKLKDNAGLQGKLAQQFATKEAAKYTEALTSAQKQQIALNASQKAATVTMLAYGAAIAAVVLILKAAANVIERISKYDDYINQQATSLKNNLSDIRSQTTELTANLKELSNAQSSLQGLTKGTQEWRDAVQDVNSQILELIDKYPELAEYVTTTNGVMSISAYGQSKVLDLQRQKLQEAQSAANIASIAQYNRQLQKLSFETPYSNPNRKNYNVQAFGGGNIEGQKDFAASKDTNNLIKEVNRVGAWILQSDKELQARGYTEEQISAIKENSYEISQLADKVQANTAATSLLTAQELENKIGKTDLPEETVNSLANFYNRYRDNFKSDVSTEDLANAYLKADPTAYDAKLKNGMLVITSKDSNGDLQSREISQEAAQLYVQSATGTDNFINQFSSTAEELYNTYGEELTSAILDYLAGGLDINDLDPETASKLQSLGSDIFTKILEGIGVKDIELPEFGEYNETYHNRIQYLGSDLGKALNERDNILGNIVELQVKLKDVDEGSEDYKNIESQINELTKSLSENADTIKLSINSSLREDVDEAFDIAKSFDTLQDKIANGLEMTTDEVVDLIDSGYGALLQNCEATSEGLISLNQNVVDAYVAQKKEEVEVDKQAKIAQLKTQRELLVVQKEALEKKLQLLDAAANADDARTAARYLAEAMMQQAIADDAAEQAAAVVGTDVEKSKALTDDAKAVADYVNDTLDATTNTAIDSNLGIAQSTYQLSQDVISYWNNMAEARANYFKINENNTVSNPVSATAGAPNVGTYGSHQNTEDVEIFDSSKLSDPQEVENQIKKWTEGILERAKNNVDAIKDAASAMMGDSRKELDLVLSQIGSIDAAIARINGNMIDSVVGGKDKGGSGSSKEAKDTAEALKEVLERYHEITREIEYQKDLLDDISNMADRAYGIDKVELLTQKIDKLNKVAELQKEKQAAAAAYVLSDLEAIRAAGMGVSYDTASYELKNYTDLLNQITDEYNSRINSVSDENRDAVQKEYDDKMKLLENYEESIDTFRDELNEYQDTMREIEDTKLDRIQAVIQIKLDWKQFQDTLREFAKEVNESVGDALDQALQATTLNKQGAQDELAMFDAYETKMNALLDAVRNANEYTDVASLQEELASMRKDLADSASALLDYVATLKNVLPDALEAASERFNEFINVLENGQQTLEAINTLANLQSINYSMADKYALLGKSYNAVLENAFTQAKLQKQYTDRAAKELEEAEIALAAATQGTAEYDILKANRDALLNEFNTAQSAMLSATQQAMEAAKSIYSNALDEIFYEFEQKMSKGMGYDLLQSKYTRTKEEDDRFLDGVNRFVETQTLNNKLQQSINAATSDYAKSTLKALEEEFAQRQSNTDLSEYDLKIMEAKYNMTLKQIALEEAQNAKSKVRLVRGANGNYNYLFTADNNDINQKQQEYLKAMQDYYNIAKQQTENITGEIVSLWKDMSSEIRKIYENDSLDADQRQSAINEIQAYYQKKYEDLIKMQKDAAKDMNDAGNSALTEEQQIANRYGDETSEVAEMFKENFKRILEEMGGDAENFNSDYSDTLLNLVALEESFTEITSAMFSKLNDALNKYKGNISNISNEIGVSYDELTRHVDMVSAANDTLKEKATGAIEEIWNKIDEIQDVTQAQAGWTSEIYKTITAMQRLAAETATAVQRYNEAISNIQSLAATGSYMTNSLNSAASNMNNTSGGGYPSSPNKPQKTPVNKTRVREQLGQFAYDGQIYKSLTQNGAVYEGGGWWNFYPENRSRLKTIIATTKNGNKGKSFATGGYTGEWSNGDTEGRVAMLHQKELVLNKTDTENMLAAVQAIRDFSPELIASIRAKLSAVSLASQSLMGSRLASSSPDFSKEPTELAQNVNINADFPGVRDAIEIKEALESLVQTSAQRINFYTK